MPGETCSMMHVASKRSIHLVSLGPLIINSNRIQSHRELLSVPSARAPVDFDFDVPPSCPVATPVLPNSHQP